MIERLSFLQQFIFFFFNDTATTEIYTLSLHDALPICRTGACASLSMPLQHLVQACKFKVKGNRRSEEHTSELQSQSNLVCRLLLEKKKKIMLSMSINNLYLICLNVTFIYFIIAHTDIF